MIFMNFLARSSRATGPKMRVPIGSFCALMRTALFVVELDVAAVGAAVLALGADDDGLAPCRPSSPWCRAAPP